MSWPCGLTLKRTLGKVCLSIFLLIVCLTYSGIPYLGRVCLGMPPFIVWLTYSYIPWGIMPRYGTSSRRLMSSLVWWIYLRYDIPKYPIPFTLYLFSCAKYNVSIWTLIFLCSKFLFYLVWNTLASWLQKKVLPPIYCEIFYYFLYLIFIYIKLE